MPLQRGEILGYDFNRMVVEFTMFNQGAIAWPVYLHSGAEIFDDAMKRLEVVNGVSGALSWYVSNRRFQAKLPTFREQLKDLRKAPTQRNSKSVSRNSELSLLNRKSQNCDCAQPTHS
jgi:hypothetical protein